MYDYTKEQLTIFDTINTAVETGTPDFIKVEAVAGSSKSSSLVEAVKRLPKETTVRYLVFGTAAAAEAKVDFKHTAQVSTLHSLAYQYVVKEYGLSNIRPFLTWKDVPSNIKIPFGFTFDVLNYVEDFCTTILDSIEAYIELNDIPYQLVKPTIEVFNAIMEGKMPCTHSYYLKVFHHEVMNGNIEIEPTDLLLVDEAGDLTAITIDIVKKYPAKVKVIVGDSFQSIFGFMNTINAFTVFKDKGITLHLSKTFRVSAPIAKKIENFCKNTIDKSFVFEGMDYPDNPTITTKGILCRTNLDVLRWMVTYKANNRAFRLSSKAKISQIFSLPMALLSKPGGKQYSKDLQYIQDLIDDWGKTGSFGSKTSYILEHSEGDPSIKKAIAILTKFGPEVLIATKKYAESHKGSAEGDLIATAHTSKGMTLDHIYVDESMNASLDKIQEENPELFVDGYPTIKANAPLEGEIREEMNLYYVVCSRCRHQLDNARYIV